MQEEIEKMSDEKLVKELELQNIDYAMEYDKEELKNIEKNCDNLRAELLKRLSKNNINTDSVSDLCNKSIEKFKKKLIENIENIEWNEDVNGIKHKNIFIDLINNIGKE